MQMNGCARTESRCHVFFRVLIVMWNMPDCGDVYGRGAWEGVFKFSLITFFGRSASPPFAGVLGTGAGGGGEWWTGGADDGNGLRFLFAACAPLTAGEGRGSEAGDPVRAAADDEPGSAVRFGPAGVATMVDETAGAAAFAARTLSRMRDGSLSQALNTMVTIFDGRPLTPFSARATFFGRSTSSPSSLFRFLGGLGRFSAAFAAPFSC